LTETTAPTIQNPGSVTFPAAVTGAEAPKPAETPALPEKFKGKSAEEIAASYAELEANFTRTQQELAGLKKTPADTNTTPPKKEGAEATTTDPEKKPANGLEVPEDKAAAEVVAKAGLDVSASQTEFDTTGDVSEENRAKLAESLKATLGDDARAVIDQYIEGKKATLANYSNKVKTTAGSEEAYVELVTWAKTNLSKEEKVAFNNAVNSGDINAATLAVEGLKARAAKAGHSNPELVGGDRSQSIVGFKSTAEMISAMSEKDPATGKVKYASDPAYRKSVEARVAASNF